MITEMVEADMKLMKTGRLEHTATISTKSLL